jgi:hypothetical protein
MILLVGVGACSGEADAPVADKPAAKPAARPAALVFPDSIRVADESVNAFVTRAMTICASRRYDDFRLLWSARETPMSSGEFEESWNAVKDIRVRSVEKAKLAADAASPGEAPQLVYAVAAEVVLDPAHRAAQREPKRDVVLMLVREHDQWRLARAPKPMRDWMQEKLAARAADSPASEPGDGNR